MPSQYQHISRYQNFFGVDYKSNDLQFPEKYAQDLLNADIVANGAIQKRSGYQGFASDIGHVFFGLTTYNKFDSSGNTTQELIGISDTLYKLQTTTLTITYAGALTVVTFGIVFDVITSVFRCVVETGAGTILNYSLGTGYESPAITIANLTAQINSLAGFTASYTGDGTIPAALLKTVPVQSMVVVAPAISTILTTQSKYWQVLPYAPQSPNTFPFYNRYNNLDYDYQRNQVNATAIQLQNCLYVATGFDFTLKYDGQNVYRAGLPPASDGSDGTYSAFVVPFPNVLGPQEYYTWKYQFIQTDAVGNIVESNPVTATVLLGGSETLIAHSFRPLVAYVAGNQVAVTTITIDDGAGNPIAYVPGIGNNITFTDSTGNVVTKTLIAPTNSTQLSFAGAVTVNDNIQIFLVSSAPLSLKPILLGSGFNTNCAIANGAQVIGGVGNKTINVDNGTGGIHTFIAGDTAYFKDTLLGYVTYSIVSVTNTSITVAAGAAAINIADNEVISNNLKIRIIRNKNTGTAPTLFYEVIELANNAFAASMFPSPLQTYTDIFTDNELGAQIPLPVTDRSPPVKGKYLSAYQGLMISAGDPQNVNQVSISDIENHEYFPLVENQYTVDTMQGDIITGIHPASAAFLIFQSRAIHGMIGDIPEKNFRIDLLTQDVGCVAHATIEDIKGSTVFLSKLGPRVMYGTSLPKGLGAYELNDNISRIDPFFTQIGLDRDQTFNLNRAIGFNDTFRQKYYLFVPCEYGSIHTPSKSWVTNEYSRVLCFDYTRDAWLVFDNIDMTGGITSYDQNKEIIFIERKLNPSVSLNNFLDSLDMRTFLYRFQNSGTYLDYQDHEQPIEFYYKSMWEFAGQANTLKNFQRIRIYSSEYMTNDFTIDVATEKDFVNANTISTLQITFDGAGIGLNPYGSGNYGSSTIHRFQKHKLSNGRAVSLKCVFSNNEAQKNISITAYELEISAPYQPGFKV